MKYTSGAYVKGMEYQPQWVDGKPVYVDYDARVAARKECKARFNKKRRKWQDSRRIIPSA